MTTRAGFYRRSKLSELDTKNIHNKFSFKKNIFLAIIAKEFDGGPREGNVGDYEFRTQFRLQYRGKLLKISVSLKRVIYLISQNEIVNSFILKCT